jgi:hypothetical protein
MGKLIGLVVVLIILAVIYYLYIHKGKPEVYLITSPDGSYQTTFADALKVAKTFDPDATLATAEQIKEVQSLGAQWCSTGWGEDGVRRFPMQISAPGCGEPGVVAWGPTDPKANVIVYGIKPTQDQVASSESKLKVLPFYDPAISAKDTKSMKWSQWDP